MHWNYLRFFLRHSVHFRHTTFREHKRNRTNEHHHINSTDWHITWHFVFRTRSLFLLKPPLLSSWVLIFLSDPRYQKVRQLIQLSSVLLSVCLNALRPYSSQYLLVIYPFNPVPYTPYPFLKDSILSFSLVPESISQPYVLRTKSILL